MQGVHHEKIGESVERDHVGAVMMLLEQIYRLPVRRAESFVDLGNRLIDREFLCLIACEVVATGHSDLNKADFAPPFIVIFEKMFDPIQALGNTFRVI